MAARLERAVESQAAPGPPSTPSAHSAQTQDVGLDGTPERNFVIAETEAARHVDAVWLQPTLPTAWHNTVDYASSEPGDALLLRELSTEREHAEEGTVLSIPIISLQPLLFAYRLIIFLLQRPQDTCERIRCSELLDRPVADL